MAKTHKVSPERFRHLAQRIQIAAKLEDWKSLMRYDQQLQELLATHQAYLNDPRLAPEIARIKTIHQAAFEQLSQATSELEQTMNDVRMQQERAMAYQLATQDGELR